ncbi:ParB N-terminal domain-containing protein [Pantoea sp. GbtcB22]|uniref:ParB N-terminal domain-containing protein n=1 Tax=Pantoea sp. GbtcB22 TaxID=2824767 RepID=UPI001C30A0C2|nr:ParB N-terminal domain-containing protein [Pantoea sp. GbtcB22]
MSQQNVNFTASESKESSVLKTKPVRRPAKAKADKAAAMAVEQALEKVEIEMIPLSRLAVSPLNVRRKVYVQSRIESLAATIKNVGLLHNLIAHDMPDGLLGVACGGRRLTALQLLLAQGVYQHDQLTPVNRIHNGYGHLLTAGACGSLEGRRASGDMLFIVLLKGLIPVAGLGMLAWGTWLSRSGEAMPDAADSPDAVNSTMGAGLPYVMMALGIMMLVTGYRILRR